MAAVATLVALLDTVNDDAPFVLTVVVFAVGYAVLPLVAPNVIVQSFLSITQEYVPVLEFPSLVTTL